MTAPKESSSLPPELTFFGREICNRLAKLSPAELGDTLQAVIRITAELTRELDGRRRPELVDEYFRACRGGLH